MREQFFRIRFTISHSVLFEPFDRWISSIKEMIAQYTRQGWELVSVCDRPIGLADYEVIALMKRSG